MSCEIAWGLSAVLFMTSAWFGAALLRAKQASRVTRLEASRHEAIVDNVPDSIISVDENHRIVLFNPAAEQMFGCDRGQALGEKLSKFVVTNLSTLPTAGVAWSESIPGSTFMAQEVRALHQDGREIEAEASISQITEPGPQGERQLMTVVLRDIGLRKRAEKSLRETQASLIEAQRIAHLGYFSYETSSRRWTLAPSMLELLGDTDRGKAQTLAQFDDIHPDDRALLNEQLRLAGMRNSRGLNVEFRVFRRDDSQELWLHALGRPRQDERGQTLHLFGSMQDITERKLASLALEQSQEELRRLSANLTQVREEERRHLARDLHDELGQRLSALKLDLFTLMSQPDVRAAGLDKRLQPLIKSINNAVTETRRIASNLRPAMLDDLGLIAAIEWLANEWSGRLAFEIELDCEAIDDELNEAATTTIYRIVQEALTNISRHAQAKHGRIELRRVGGELLVAIEDDGKGIQQGDIEKFDSYGLAGIRERARIVGGQAVIRNKARGGCRLEVRVPLERVSTGLGELQVLT
jgi:PAS domain S-box-containing protein